jgi:uroporphyrinogen decarboxylase
MSSKERVRAAVGHRRADRIPRGELVIDDELIRRSFNRDRIDFEERATLIEDLGLDLVVLAPAYPVDRSVPAALDDPLPDLGKWASRTSLFIFALIDGPFGWGARTLGYTEFLVALSRNSPCSCRALIEKVERLNSELIAALVGRGVDGIIIADDLAYNRGLMINPKTLRELYFPSLARQLEAAGETVPLFFHSDGDYALIIPDLIDCGFVGLQCFEKRAGMDPLKLKALYPELCFWGTLEVEDLQRAHKSAYLEKLLSEIRTLSQDGGFILGTTCGLFQGIDLEGLKAVYSQLSGPSAR